MLPSDDAALRSLIAAQFSVKQKEKDIPETGMSFMSLN